MKKPTGRQQNPAVNEQKIKKVETYIYLGHVLTMKKQYP